MIFFNFFANDAIGCAEFEPLQAVANVGHCLLKRYDLLHLASVVYSFALGGTYHLALRLHILSVQEAYFGKREVKPLRQFDAMVVLLFVHLLTCLQHLIGGIVKAHIVDDLTVFFMCFRIFFIAVL